MSHKLYLDGYCNGKEDGVLLSDLERLVRISPHHCERDSYVFRYDNLTTCVMTAIIESGKAVAITIFDPCSHDAFWQDLFFK